MRWAGLEAAGRIAQATGCRLMCGRPIARAERGLGLPAPDPIPYLPEMALEAFAGVRSVVFAGAMDPVTFFGWPGYPSRVIGEGCAKTWLAEPHEDIVGALEALAEHLNAPAYRAPPPQNSALFFSQLARLKFSSANDQFTRLPRNVLM